MEFIAWVVADGTENGSRTGTSMRQALYFMDDLGLNLHQELYYEHAGPPPDPTRYEQTIDKMYVFSLGRPNTINLIRDKKNRWANTRQFGNKSTRERDGSLTKKPASIIAEYGKRTVVWRYATGYRYSTKDKYAFEHPAIYPEKLARDHISSWTNDGDVVLDPFAGSGTTGKMCVSSGRKFVGCEISDKYFEIAKRRIQEAQLQTRMEI